MRSYSNYLLFEGIVENLLGDDSVISTLASSLLLPTVKLVEEDCNTSLGSKTRLTFDLEGDILVETKLPLTYSDIYSLLQSGKYNVGLRRASSCNSEGGICRICAQGSLLGETIPAVGNGIILVPQFQYRTDFFKSDGVRANYPLRTDYDIAKVVVDGQVVQTCNNGESLILTSIPPLNKSFIVKYYISDSSSLLGYLGRTYSGGLLGIQPLDTPPLSVKESLYNEILSDGQIATLEDEVSQLSTIETRYFEYAQSVHSKLEKSLLLLYLYSIFNDIISE